MANRKYRFVEDFLDPATGKPFENTGSPKVIKTRHFGTLTLHQIARIKYRKVADNSKSIVETMGAKGGWIESYGNLPQEGACWVDGNAIVVGEALISGDAKVSGSVEIGDNAKISDKAVVQGHSCVRGHAHIYGNGVVAGNDRVAVTDEACVCGKVLADAKVSEEAKVFKDGEISGKAEIGGQVLVYGRVGGEAEVEGTSVIKGIVRGNAKVLGSTIVLKDGLVVGESYVDGGVVKGEIGGETQFGNVGGKIASSPIMLGGRVQGESEVSGNVIFDGVVEGATTIDGNARVGGSVRGEKNHIGGNSSFFGVLRGKKMSTEGSRVYGTLLGKEKNPSSDDIEDSYVTASLIDKKGQIIGGSLIRFSLIFGVVSGTEEHMTRTYTSLMSIVGDNSLVLPGEEFSREVKFDRKKGEKVEDLPPSDKNLRWGEMIRGGMASLPSADARFNQHTYSYGWNKVGYEYTYEYYKYVADKEKEEWEAFLKQKQKQYREDRGL